MRVLFTGMPVYSHLAPMLIPIARAVRAAGHEVAVATGGSLSAVLAEQGLPHRVLPTMLAPDEFRDDPEFAEAIGLRPDGVPLPVLNELPRGVGFGRLFAGEAAVRNARGLRPVAEQFRPDLIVRECTEFAGLLVAEQLGVPCVTLDTAPMTPTRHPGLLPTLNQTRETLGLAATDVAVLTRDPWIGWLPARWWPDDLRTSAHRYYRPPVSTTPEPLDPAIVALPADRPLVLATLGSNTGHMLAGQRSPLADIVTALGELPCTAVVAVGTDPAGWPGPRPDNVLLVGFAQQRLLLAACDLFVTHAGMGGIQEALSAGVPMVALPLYAEQPVNAARLAELGVAVTVSAESGPAELVSACRKVLDEPSFRHAARGLQRGILGLPDLGRLVADLAALGG